MTKYDTIETLYARLEELEKERDEINKYNDFRKCSDDMMLFVNAMIDSGFTRDEVMILMCSTLKK